MARPSRNLALTWALALTLGGVAACGSPSTEGSNQSSYDQRRPITSYQDKGLHGMVNRAAEHLARSGLSRGQKGDPVIVASVVNIDHLESSSTLGRLAAKQVSGRLVRMGYNVREVNFRNTLAVREGTGELMLTRDLKHLSEEAGAQAVVTGTYAIGGETVAFHLNMVRASDGTILASSDFVVPLTKDVRGYLYPGTGHSFAIDHET